MKSHCYALTDRVDESCETNSECVKLLVDNGSVCGACKGVWGHQSINIQVEELPLRSQMLSWSSAIFGVVFINDKLVEQLGVDLKRYGHLGTLSLTGRGQIPGWNTYVARELWIPRGTSCAEYRLCEVCGCVIYYAKISTFLFPAPTCPVVGSAGRGLIVAEDVYASFDMKSPVWRTVKITPLEIPTVPLDGFTELSSKVSWTKQSPAAAQKKSDPQIDLLSSVEPPHGVANDNAAVQRIERCSHSRQPVVELDLSELNLEDFPQELRNLAGLKVLDLSNNQLISLPPEIGELDQLVDLFLMANQLLSLPREIGRLSALSRLDLTENLLSELPEEIGRLSALSSLSLAGNQLGILPKQIKRLTNLRELILYGNELKEIGPEIGELCCLSSLDLSGNYLTALPAEIGKLQNLRELYVAGNQLESLPAEICQLRHLTKFDLSGNQLTSLPKQLGEMANLKEIFISGNSITKLDKSIRSKLKDRIPKS